jgi:hypothetical protein
MRSAQSRCRMQAHKMCREGTAFEGVKRLGGDLRGAVFLRGTVFNSTNTDCAGAHNRPR